MIEEHGPSPVTLFWVCTLENDPLFENPRNHSFMSRAPQESLLFGANDSSPLAYSDHGAHCGLSDTGGPWNS
eukprot:10004090-Prorocentrum_lima.AAC.1